MKRTISIKKLGGAFALGVLTMVLGCESVAILPRDDVGDRRGYGDRRDADRRDSDRDSPRDQVYGRVQDVNERRREIRVRTEDDRTSVVRYDDNTRISDGSRDIRADSLRDGDAVSIRLERNSDAGQYANTIRVENRRGG